MVLIQRIKPKIILISCFCKKNIMFPNPKLKIHRTNTHERQKLFGRLRSRRSRDATRDVNPHKKTLNACVVMV